MFTKLAALRIEPSDLCDDAEFLRRAFLDTIGILPTPDEVRTFLADAARQAGQADRRLAGRPEFVDYWTVQLGDLLQNRKERDHDVRGTKGVRAFHDWLREQVAANRPWDELARDVLTAKGAAPTIPRSATTSSPSARSARPSAPRWSARWPRRSSARASAAPSATTTRWNATRRTIITTSPASSRASSSTARTRSKGADGAERGRAGRQAEQGPGRRRPAAHRAVPQAAAARPLADRPSSPDEDPRVKLAAWMTDPKNEYFSGAMVNRLWRHFLGVGLVEPVDDLRASNPPTNPELWQALEPGIRRAPLRPEAPDAADPEFADLPALLGDPAGQREGRPLLFALLRPPAAGRGAAGRPEPDAPACPTSFPAIRSACAPASCRTRR